MTTYKFPLTSANVTRFFVLFILLLLLASGFMIQNAVSAWLTARHYVMNDITHAMQKRIDTYRFATCRFMKIWQRPQRVQRLPKAYRKPDCVPMSTRWKRTGAKRRR
mgnify:CR=1 FL=1